MLKEKMLENRKMIEQSVRYDRKLWPDAIMNKIKESQESQQEKNIIIDDAGLDLENMIDCDEWEGDFYKTKTNLNKLTHSIHSHSSPDLKHEEKKLEVYWEPARHHNQKQQDWDKIKARWRHWRTESQTFNNDFVQSLS